MSDADRLREAADECEELVIANIYGTNPDTSKHYAQVAALLRAVAYYNEPCDTLDHDRSTCPWEAAAALADVILDGDQDV